MSWVRRAPHVPHRCAPPARSWLAVPRPDGRFGELWRCDDCRKLWRIGRACATCDAYGEHMGGGQCMVGTAWRPATLWQHLRYRRSHHKDSDLDSVPVEETTPNA